jgi:hypothetical protein
MFTFIGRRMSPEIAYLAVLAGAVFGFAAFICVSAVHFHPAFAPQHLASIDTGALAKSEPLQTAVPETPASERPLPDAADEDLPPAHPYLSAEPEARPATRPAPSVGAAALGHRNP